MNITPNYQMKTLNFTSVVGQAQLKTAAKTAQKYVAPNAKELKGPVAAALAAMVLAKPNLEKAEQTEIKLPTREEFNDMLEKDGIVNHKYFAEWSKAFDNNPLNVLELYNLTDKNGNRFIIRDRLFQHYLDSLDAKKMKAVLNTENALGDCPFSFNDAIVISHSANNISYSGLTKMLGLRTDDGELRFTSSDDYSAAEAFEKNPVLATEYAYATDDIGNYRFLSGETIENLVKIKTEGKYPPEKLDEMLDLRRPDGTYVFSEFPGSTLYSSIKAFISNPETFKELCGLRVARDEKYLESNEIDSFVTPYLSHPDEIKYILQKLPRFSHLEVSITEKAGEMLKQAPISFNRLAKMRNEDGYTFHNLKDICDVIEQFNLIDTEKNNPDGLKNTLALISTLACARRNSFKLDITQMRQAAEIYPKYPEETLDIIRKYIKRTDGGYKAVIPTEEEISLYNANPGALDEKYEAFPDSY